MTWKEEIKKEIIKNGFDRRPFTLKEFYESSEESLKIGKDSNSVKASIRANLQNLRDEGFLIFLEKGLYEVRKENANKRVIEGEEYIKAKPIDETIDIEENEVREENEVKEENEEIIKRRIETPKIGIQINYMISKRQEGKCRNPNCIYKSISNFNWYLIPLENDHRKRVCDGGENNINNRQLLCPTCHKIKTINEQRLDELNSSEKAELLILQTSYEENEPI
jgi:5-methylcytosine-specific restriction endonuclease McrA